MPYRGNKASVFTLIKSEEPRQLPGIRRKLMEQVNKRVLNTLPSVQVQIHKDPAQQTEVHDDSPTLHNAEIVFSSNRLYGHVTTSAGSEEHAEIRGYKWGRYSIELY